MTVTRLALQRSAPSSVAAWLLLLGGLIGADAYLMLGQPTVAARVFPAFTLVSTAAIAVGIVANRPAERRAWIWLGAAMALWTVGDATWGWTVTVPHFPTAADAFYLLGYLCFAFMLRGLTVLPGTFDAGRILDSLIAGLGFGVLIWSFSITPAVQASGLHWVAALFPAFDIAILVALAPFVARHRRSPSAWLLVLGFAFVLPSDAHYGAAAIAGTYMSGTPGDAGWVIGYLALGAAALHPSMARMGPFATDESGRWLWLRSIFLGSAILVLPVGAAGQRLLGRAPDLEVTLAASSLMAVLVIARLHVTLLDLLRREDRFRAFMRSPGISALIKDRAGRYVYATENVVGLNGHEGSDWRGRTDAELLDPVRAARQAQIDEIVRRSGKPVSHEERLNGPDGPRWFHTETFPVRSESGSIGVLGVDITERVLAEAKARRLAAAVEQTHDSIVITGLDGRIEYVNPAFEALTGYSREELIGQNSRMLKSGRQSDAFYRAMWATLLAGQPWVAEFVNRAKGGALFIDQESISPVRDETGSVTHYVAVHHDVTHERELETRDVRLQRERALISDTLRRIGPRASPEETAEAICRQIVSLSGVACADLLLFGLDGQATSLAMVVATGEPPSRRAIPLRRGRMLRLRASEGPWVELWTHRPWHPYSRSFAAIGVQAVGYAPVYAAGELIGLLAVASAREDAVALLTDNLPSIAEFAGVAGALLGPAVTQRTELARVRAAVQRVIAERAFHPVFQPIIDHVRGITVGYEALTRFDDGVAPDTRFAEAAAVGLGHELEEVTLRQALEESEHLPRAVFLSVNVSPEFVSSGGLVSPARRHRSLVLEITEHAVIDDYERILADAGRLGPRVMLAVDDAGAGFASLHHVIELRPKFVKLDRSLIAGIDTDDGRRALAVGMLHFARQVGCHIIAEGVETAAELEVLRDAGIRLAQGFLLGRPRPVDDWR